MPRCFFCLQRSRCDSNELQWLKTTGRHDDLLLLFSLFHFFYFIFRDPISFSLFSNFSISFLFFFLKPLSSVVEMLVCVCVCVHSCQSLSHTWLFETQLMAAHQASLSLLFPKVCANSYLLSQWCHPTEKLLLNGERVQNYWPPEMNSI